MKKSVKNNIKNNDNNNGEELFKLLGDLDEEMVEDAWAEHGEEVIIMEQRSPFRLVKIAAAAAAAILVVGGGIYGFNKLKNGVSFSPAASSISEDEGSNSEDEGSNSEELSEPESSEPETSEIENRDEPTIFIGFNNDHIMSSDVTSTNTDKKPSEILPEDVGTIVCCGGFSYFREPMGVAYNSFQNPELFTFTGNPDKTDGNSFYGEMPQNTNEYKRLYVGEKMCGLTLKHATTQFLINEPGEGTRIEIGPADMTEVSFDGQIEVEGILCVTAPNLNNHGGWYRFYPTEDKLPILGATQKTVMDYRIAYAHETCAVHIVNEYPEIQIDKAIGHYNEIDGIDIGDAVFARVTLGDIGYSYKGYVRANMDAVEILSEPIAHVDEWMQK